MDCHHYRERLIKPQLKVDAELRAELFAVQATIEKASIDEVYIDATAMVDKELQVLVPLMCCTLLPKSQELTVISNHCRDVGSVL